MMPVISLRVCFVEGRAGRARQVTAWRDTAQDEPRAPTAAQALTRSDANAPTPGAAARGAVRGDGGDDWHCAPERAWQCCSFSSSVSFIARGERRRRRRLRAGTQSLSLAGSQRVALRGSLWGALGGSEFECLIAARVCACSFVYIICYI